MGAFVALFRAINLGDYNKVGMAALKEIHEALGLKNVASYLQTGNVVFESDETDSGQLAGQISREFEKQFGFKTEVMVRSSAELKELFDKNPFVKSPDKETKWIVVLFLAASPATQAIKDLQSAYTGPEEMIFADKDMYIYYPNGIGRSKLTNVLIEKKLKVSGTGRNWNTVTKLLEMTQP